MEIKRLEEVAAVERTKAGEILQEGVSLIRLSACNGNVIFTENKVRGEAGWVKLTAKEGIDPKYLYYQTGYEMQRFLERYQTGINLKFEELKYFKIRTIPIEQQKNFVKALDLIDKNIKREEETVNKIQQYKRKMLHQMFAQN